MKFAGLELIEDGGKFYFEDEALKQTHDPKCPNYAKLEEFQRLNNLKISRSALWPKWVALLPPHLRPRRLSRCQREAPKQALWAMKDIDDHSILFVRNGRYCYTTQPYNLTLRAYQRVKEYWEAQSLIVDISYQSAWWYPGSTPLIIVAQMPIELAK